MFPVVSRKQIYWVENINDIPIRTRYSRFFAQPSDEQVNKLDAEIKAGQSVAAVWENDVCVYDVLR